jgi:hypothetical protein
MDRYEYMKIKADLIPDAFLDDTTYMTKYTVVSYIARFVEACTASHKLESLQRNLSKKASPSMVTTNSHTHQDCGDTSTGLSSSHW